ncbi:unnamed protein product, partial [Mesorhabditis spiculigera]
MWDPFDFLKVTLEDLRARGDNRRHSAHQKCAAGGRQARKYLSDLGPSRDVYFTCQVVKLNGQKAKAVLKKTTLFRRILTDKEETEEHVSARTIPLDQKLRKSFTAKGTTYYADIKMTKQMSDRPLPNIEFDDLVELKPAYSGELQERSYTLLHLTFIYYQMPSIYLKLISLSVFLVWDNSIAPIAAGVLPSAIRTIERHQEQPEICRTFTHCMEYLFDCLIGVIDDHLAPISSGGPPRRPTRLNLPTSQSSANLIHRTVDRQKSDQSKSSLSNSVTKLRSSSILSNTSAASQTSKKSRQAKQRLLKRSLSYNPHPKLERVPSIRSAISKSHESHPELPPNFTQKRKSVTLLDQLIDLPARLQVFPPEEGPLMQEFHKMMLPVAHICALTAWEYCEFLDPAAYLANKLRILIALSVQHWSRTKFVVESQDVHSLCTHLQKLVRSIYFNYKPYAVYFEQFSINYLKIVYETLDVPLEAVLRNIIETATAELNARDYEKLDVYSKNTMKAYAAVSNMKKIAKASNITVPLLSKFELCFSSCVVFWTTAWRETSLLMVSRTTPLDEDDGRQREFGDSDRKLPSGLYSFLCIQKGLSDDILTLNLEYPQHALLVTLRIIHIFTENLVAYARKLYAEARPDFTCKNHSRKCDCVRSVRAANGIDHAIEYIEKNWVKFSDWERIEGMLATNEAEKIRVTIEAMLRTCKEQCDCLADRLIAKNYGDTRAETVKYARQLCLDRQEYTKTLASYVRDRIDAFHNSETIINAMEKVVEGVEKDFYPRRAKRILTGLWHFFEAELARSLKEFQTHEYYRNIYVALKIIREQLHGPKNPSKFAKDLQLKSLATEDLMLAYYAAMADQEDTTGEGSTLCLQATYVRSREEDKVRFVIKVREARIPQPLNTLCSSAEISVRLELLPKTVFSEHHFPPITTSNRPVSGNPKWGEAFQVLMGDEGFFTNGTVLSASLIERDKIGCERVLGKAFLALNQVREISTKSTTDRLCRPFLALPTGSRLGYYNVLRERVLFDKVARAFWKKERPHKDVQINLKQLREVPKRWGSLRRFRSERFGSPRISFSIQRPQRTVSTI